MGRRRFWASLSCTYDEDPVLEAIAETFPAVFALWPWLIAKCQLASDAGTNPEGWMEMRRQRAARALYCDAVADRGLWDALIDGELIRLRDDRNDLDGVYVVRLARFGKHQQPLGSEGYRKRTERKRAGENGSGVPSATVLVPCTSPHINTKINKEERDMSENGRSQTAGKSRAAKKDRADDIAAVFDYWKELTAKTKGPSPKLSDKRRSRIKARLSDGFTVDQLKQSLWGYTRDPHFNGENGKHYLELAFRLADIENVERGLQLATNFQHLAVGGNNGHITPEQAEHNARFTAWPDEVVAKLNRASDEAGGS